MFWEGFEGWRHPSWLQNEVLETLEAGLGADEVLRGSWMICWRSRGALAAQGRGSAGWPAGHRILITRDLEGKMAFHGPIQQATNSLQPAPSN